MLGAEEASADLDGWPPGILGPCLEGYPDKDIHDLGEGPWRETLGCGREKLPRVGDTNRDEC